VGLFTRHDRSHATRDAVTRAQTIAFLNASQRQIGGQASYRLGKVDRATRNYQPPARSGDAAAYDSSELMHRRVRDQDRNNSHIRRLVEVIPDLIVGTGLQTLADPFEPWIDLADLTPDDLDERLAYALESDEYYEEYWHDPKQVDVAGKLAGPDLQRLFISECVRTGAALLVKSIVQTTGDKIPLRYQLIEREQLDTTRDQVGGEDGNRVVNGIELDLYGREVAFWIYDAHPDDSFLVTRGSTRVPAERVLHVFRQERPSQNVGVSWLHAIGQNEIDRDKFMGAELQTAAKNASLAMVWKKKNPNRGSMGIVDAFDDVDEYGNEDLKLGSSPIAAVIGPDDVVEMIESKRPNANAESFFRLIDRYTAAGAGVSYYTLTGDYSSTSFSSTRAAKLDEDAHILPIQRWFARQVALPIRRDFNRLAVGAGLLSTVTARQFLANERRYQRFESMGPGRDLLDPDSETNAKIGRLRSGLSTLKIECANLGRHWVRVLRQIALENHVCDMLGVVLDFSKGQGGQVTGNTRAADTTTATTTATTEAAP